MIDDKMLHSILSERVEMIPVEPPIYAPASEYFCENEYDRMDWFYDVVIGNALYNRLMWGYPISSLGELCSKALSGSSGEWVLDVGCGSLVFTAEVYAQNTSRPIALVDQSLEMLRRAKSRMTRICKEVPKNMVFFHADAHNLPFRSNVFSTLVCLNLLHVLKDPAAFLRELFRVTTRDCGMAFTTLVLNNRFGDSYMKFLSNKGLIISRTARDVTTLFYAFGSSFDHSLNGNMLFIHNL